MQRFQSSSFELEREVYDGYTQIFGIDGQTGSPDTSCHLPDPYLQRPQLLGVFVAGLVVGGNGSGDGRERNACGGRISISGGFGQLTGGGSVVQAHKATVDSASSIGLNGHIDGNLLDDGVALLADDSDAVDVLGDDLDGGLRLPLTDGGELQGLLLDGCVPLGLNELAPDIIEQFMAGGQPRRLTLMWFQRNRLMVDWHAQRQLMASFEEDV